MVCLMRVVRRFEHGVIMQDVMSSLHLATFAKILSCAGAFIHVGRKSASTSPQATELNPGISGKVAAWLRATCGND